MSQPDRPHIQSYELPQVLYNGQQLSVLKVTVTCGGSERSSKWAAEASLSAASGLNAFALKHSAHVNALSRSAFLPAGLARYAKQSLPTGGLRGAAPAALPWGRHWEGSERSSRALRDTEPPAAGALPPRSALRSRRLLGSDPG
ncbi:uncharacterized protein LOC121113147 [Gallus gallus]|uniref:uncharacterized protein LOC121113147 n=1 Tax=Gallus gallus TaxID=9031 RepID=UPI001AE8A917|nr:uncharacterized protein LOC121113147 [Gallus gallus]